MQIASTWSINRVLSSETGDCEKVLIFILKVYFDSGDFSTKSYLKKDVNIYVKKRKMSSTHVHEPIMEQRVGSWNQNLLKLLTYLCMYIPTYI
jgi:hypothetical protein